MISDNDISNPIHKTICNALGCNQTAETNVKVNLEKREIILFFCKDCLVKFTNYSIR